MARKYGPENLMAPSGRFQLAMWPGASPTDITADLEAWLDDGYAKAESTGNVDEAALAWAYFRGFEARATQLAAMDATVAIPNQVTTTRTDQQRTYFETMARYWLGVFDGYTTTGETNDSVIPPSGSSKVHFGWAGTL